MNCLTKANPRNAISMVVRLDEDDSSTRSNVNNTRVAYQWSLLKYAKSDGNGQVDDTNLVPVLNLANSSATGKMFIGKHDVYLFNQYHTI